MPHKDDSAAPRSAATGRTRRWVLRAGGALLGAGALGAGGFVANDWWRRFGRSAERTIPDHRVEVSPSIPRMVIAHGKDPAINVRAVIEELGGMSTFVSPGDVVLVKPNVGWDRLPSQAANTQPEVIAQLVLSCREAGAGRVLVSDCPVGRPRRTFARSGILDAAQNAGAEVILVDNGQYFTVRLSERLGVWDVLEPFIIADKIINAPVVKHHSVTSATGGMKNWIGITGRTRVSFHTDLQRTIAELALLMKPTLTVVDASQVLMQNGPAGGNTADVKKIGAVTACLDPVAADAWVCDLMGATAHMMPEFVHLGADMGLGVADYRQLNPVEVTT
ncbi:MAG: DUF362 domain-containing protein [bacterium]|nr:DUF362 domain-containing protein [bacterium]